MGEDTFPPAHPDTNTSCLHMQQEYPCLNIFYLVHADNNQITELGVNRQYVCTKHVP